MREPSCLALIAGFAAVYLIWGSTYLGIFFAIQSIPPFFMAGARFLSAGIIMYVSARISGAPPRPGWIGGVLSLSADGLLFWANGGGPIPENGGPPGPPSGPVATFRFDLTFFGVSPGMA